MRTTSRNEKVMGKNSPSRRRREGRTAFEPDLNPQERCPYTSGFMFESKRRDWLDGWEEAGKQYVMFEGNEPNHMCIEKGYVFIGTSYCPFCGNEVKNI